MVAPVDSKASFEVEGETITLRLNFRSIALADAEGIDVLAGLSLSTARLTSLIHCFAVQEHPEMTEDEALAIVVRGGDQARKAILKLFEDFGGKPSAEGKAKAKKESSTES